MSAADFERGESGTAALAAQHREAWRHALGPTAPVPRMFFAPGRVNLMGAHLDYNGGPVMPVAIDRGTILAVAPRADRVLRLRSTVEAGELELDLGFRKPARTGTWCDYPLGVALALMRAAPAPHGLDVLYGGNLSIGGGLSSSASICVASAFAFDALWGLGLTRQAMVDAALWAERSFVGVKCGIMDPYAVGFARPGHLLWLDCKDASIEHLPLDGRAIAIGVADSGVRRDLARGDFNLRVEQCHAVFEQLRAFEPQARCLRDVPQDVLDRHERMLSPELARRGRHVLGEVARTLAARRALLSGDLTEFGRLMALTHESLRSLYEVSLPELDCLVESALAWPGVHGARLTGAGFGGCAVILLRPDSREGLSEHMQALFEERFGRRPRIDFYGTDRGPREL